MRFIVVGSFATRLYLPNREVDDLDLMIEPTLENARKVVDAVNANGLLQYDQSVALDLAKPNKQWRLKRDYYADILTSTDTSEFATDWADSNAGEILHQPAPIAVRVAGIRTLIRLLKSSKEDKHRRDCEELEKLLRERGQ